MLIHNHPLTPYNTFGIKCSSKYFAMVESVAGLRKLLYSESLQKEPKLILGGGSNILFTQDFEGLILYNQFKGIHVVKETEEGIVLMAYGGEVWHDLVLYTVKRQWGGLENLSLIPGSVGAAPIQNIGAYGVEIKDVFVSLDAVHMETGALRTFTKEECQFGYRNSIFKNELKGQYFIVSVCFQLQKNPSLNTSYGAIKTTLEEMAAAGEERNVATLSAAICRIRNSKLPDPKVLGNCGSFFKNPELEKAEFDELAANHPNVPNYPLDNGQVKVPAAWLIDQCGWKGKVIGNTGTYHKQALVLVNHGNAEGAEVWELAEAIQASVKERFGVLLSPEVNVI